MHEIKGKRMNRYHELGQYAFGKAVLLSSLHMWISHLMLRNLYSDRHHAGPRAGLSAVVPFQLIVMVGLGT